MQQPIVQAQRPTLPRISILLVVLILAGCSVYANLSFTVQDRRDYRYFPPFRPYADFNMNDHLGAEYLNVGRSLAEGKGFADPFTAGTGATAWMPPVFPSILAGVLWLTGGNPAWLMTIMIVLQVLALVATGLLVLGLARRSGSGIGMAVSLAIFVVVVISDFFRCGRARSCGGSSAACARSSTLSWAGRGRCSVPWMGAASEPGRNWRWRALSRLWWSCRGRCETTWCLDGSFR
jgi:hypothetical protein